MKKGKKRFVLLLGLILCLACAGCKEKEPTEDKGELVRIETVGEVRQFLFYIYGKK